MGIGKYTSVCILKWPSRTTLRVFLPVHSAITASTIPATTAISDNGLSSRPSPLRYLNSLSHWNTKEYCNYSCNNGTSFYMPQHYECGNISVLRPIKELYLGCDAFGHHVLESVVSPDSHHTETLSLSLLHTHKHTHTHTHTHTEREYSAMYLSGTFPVKINSKLPEF